MKLDHFFFVVNIATVILLLYALFRFKCFVGINDMYTPSSYRVKRIQNSVYIPNCKQVAHLVTHYVQIFLCII